MNIIVFDLDGTLADGTHREHHLREDPKDWDSYFAACGADSVIDPIMMIFDALWAEAQDFDNASMPAITRRDVQVWTGRIEQYRQETLDWFATHYGYVPKTLLMRETTDRTADDVLKRKWLHEARARGDEVILVFEDRQRVVDMWRAEGIVCCQVAKGDF